MIYLKQVTVESISEVIALEVGEDQKNTVLANVVSLAQAYVQPECRPRAIYHDDTLVGFLMYCIDRDDNEYWLYRLMIDKKFQRKGFARKAIQLLIEDLKKSDPDRRNIYLGVNEDNMSAIQFYLSLDFKFNDQIFGKERIMVLEY